MEILQSIFFNKNKYNLETAKKYLLNNNYGKYKRINEDKYYIRFTFNSRIKLQKNNYIKEIEFLGDDIKIFRYTKENKEPNFTIIFD